MRRGWKRGFRCNSSVLRQHKICPSFPFGRVLAYNLCKCFHPSLFFISAICIEIDCLPIGKADSETLFNEHIAFLLLSKSRLPPTSSLAGSLLSHQGRFIIDQLTGSSQMNRCSWLQCRLVVSSEFGTFQREPTTTPILVRCQFYWTAPTINSTYRTISTLLTQMTFPFLGCRCLSFLKLTNARIHAFWHFLALNTFWFGYK